MYPGLHPKFEFLFWTHRREDHVREVDERLGVEPPVYGQAYGGEEEEVAEAEEEGGGEEVDLGGGLVVVGAAPALVAWIEWKKTLFISASQL